MYQWVTAETWLRTEMGCSSDEFRDKLSWWIQSKCFLPFLHRRHSHYKGYFHYCGKLQHNFMGFTKSWLTSKRSCCILGMFSRESYGEVLIPQLWSRHWWFGSVGFYLLTYFYMFSGMNSSPGWPNYEHQLYECSYFLQINPVMWSSWVAKHLIPEEDSEAVVAMPWKIRKNWLGCTN